MARTFGLEPRVSGFYAHNNVGTSLYDVLHAANATIVWYQSIRPCPRSAASVEPHEKGLTMGFWHTGYMDHHEIGDEQAFSTARRTDHGCEVCGARFFTKRDLHVHKFEGHAVQRPVLVFRGRECGRSRLTVTHPTTSEDWDIRSATDITVNGLPATAERAVKQLRSFRAEVVNVDLLNGSVRQSFQFEFALADNDDLDGVDAALHRLINGRDLSARTIDDFIMRSKNFPTAAKYAGGLAEYLYGVVAKESASDSDAPAAAQKASYQPRFDRAVDVLGKYDREPAEAICGLVAFHYNHFETAMKKTHSPRVAEVSLRLQAIISGHAWPRRDLAGAPHTSLDYSLSDNTTDDVLTWTAMPLDGSAGQTARNLSAAIRSALPTDAFKLNLVAAEHFLSVDDPAAARHHAEQLRHGSKTESWYQNFRARTQGA